MSQKSKILGMLELGPVCGTRFLSEYMPRYAARIHDLRSDGHTITTEPCRLHDHSTPQVVYRLETESQMSLI
jgi:hypothetical protein